MRYATIILLAVVFLTKGCPDYLLSESVPNLCKACSYSFFHANIFHLAVNCLSLYLLYSPERLHGWRRTVTEFLICYAISVVAWYSATMPVVGISNYLFALVGIRTPSFRYRRWWLSSPTLTFIGVMLLMVFIPRISAVTHIVSFCLGVIVARFKEGVYGR